MRRILVLVAIALAVVGGYYYFTQGGKQEKGPQAVAVTTAVAAQKDMAVTLTQVGTVVANQSVAVRARLDSQITEVKFHDGDAVREGDVLFVLDDRAVAADMRQQQANLGRDKAQLENLRAQYDRSQELATKGFESKANLDQAKAAYEAQRATVAASEAALANARVLLDYTRVVAPISGRTGTINVTVGNNVKASDPQPLVTINQLKPIRVQLSLPQQALDPLRKAMAAGTIAVQAERDGVVLPVSGRLDYVDNAIDQSTGTFAARATFANEDEALWPGMFVTLKLTLGTEANALIIPEVAVQRGQSGDYVFVVAEGKAVKRPIKVARMQDTLAVIAEGLEPGETVVTDGMLTLKDGSAVKIKSDEKPKEEAPKEPKA